MKFRTRAHACAHTHTQKHTDSQVPGLDSLRYYAAEPVEASKTRKGEEEKKSDAANDQQPTYLPPPATGCLR